MEQAKRKLLASECRKLADIIDNQGLFDAVRKQFILVGTLLPVLVPTPASEGTDRERQLECLCRDLAVQLTETMSLLQQERHLAKDMAEQLAELLRLHTEALATIKSGIPKS